MPALCPLTCPEHDLDHVRRDAEAIVQSGRQRATEVVQDPMRHSLAIRLSDPGIELSFALGPALKSALRAIAEDVVSGRAIGAGPPRLSRQERERWL